MKTLLPRWGHSATTVVLSDGTEEILLFGGASADYQYNWSEFGSKNLPRLIEPRVIFFGMPDCELSTLILVVSGA